MTAPAAAQSSASPYTSATRYDAERRVTGTIAPDPDGAGGNGHPAVRNTYDAGGELIRVEAGTLADWQSHDVKPVNWSGFTVHKVTDIAYDAMDRKVKEAVSADGTSGTIQAVTQYSYDSFGRLECTAVRMNLAVFGSLPASACTAGTSGSAGPDRITRNFYDAAGQLLKVQQGVGMSVQIDYARYEYTANGKQRAVIDANGNRAEFTYDGHDRRVKWAFPSTTTAGAVNASDYEQYAYDTNGNRTSLRKRDGRTIDYAYDALNRVTSKTYPSGGARAVHYAYDLRGLQTAARFDSASGTDAVLSAWDGFGRQTSSTTAMGGTSRTLTYQYDANDNRTRITWPDSQYVNSVYDGLDRFYFSSVSGISNLSYTSYDAAGRTGIHYRWGGTTWKSSTTFGYDSISRLNSYSHWFANSIADVATSFNYNPANQIASRTRNNDDYRFTGHTPIDRGYARNGLNQYTGAGAVSFGYDANGNLTSEGSTIYTYDIENRLTSVSTGVTLTYDPLGRLAQVTKTPNTTQFLYDGDALVAEYDGAGNMLKRYVHGPSAGVDDPAVEYVGSSIASPRPLFADHQGSIIAIADADGNRVAINGYDEYGIPNGNIVNGQFVPTNTGRFQYTGQAWIPELGMYHYKARIYSPTLGRFLQVDPVGYDDQINLYAYVRNDPVNALDPTGMLEVRAESPTAARQLETMINSRAEGTYRFDDNNVLSKTADAANPKANSETYASTLDAMIASPNVARLDVAQTLIANGGAHNVDAAFGGGVTVSRPGSKDVRVVVSGNGLDKVPAVGGGTIKQTGADILFHEISVHAGPIMLGGQQSIQNENNIRKEIPGMKQRDIDPSHPR
ncbi:RHS repeat-associated core domain-containing protein [Sphingomonas koreensis]